MIWDDLYPAKIGKCNRSAELQTSLDRKLRSKHLRTALQNHSSMSGKNATTALARLARLAGVILPLTSSRRIWPWWNRLQNLGLWCKVADPEVPRSSEKRCPAIRNWKLIHLCNVDALSLHVSTSSQSSTDPEQKTFGITRLCKTLDFWLTKTDLNMFSFLRWFSCHVCSQQGGTRLGSVGNDSKPLVSAVWAMPQNWHVPTT